MGPKKSQLLKVGALTLSKISKWSNQSKNWYIYVEGVGPRKSQLLKVGAQTLSNISKGPIGQKIGTDCYFGIEILKMIVTWKVWGQRSGHC